MKKTVLVSVIGILAVTSYANAGFWSKLGFGKTSEPQTLEEACNKDDITKICPEIVLGEKTLIQCLSENVTSLSKKCANYVKKSVTDGITDANARVADARAELENAKVEQAAAKDAKKAEIAAQKAEAKAAADEVKDSVKQTGKDLKETGKSLKNLF